MRPSSHSTLGISAPGAIVLVLTAFTAGIPVASASCASQEASMMQTIQSFSARAGNMGICDMAHEASRVYARALHFYQNCPINDPDGSMRRHAREMIDWSQEARVACAR